MTITIEPIRELSFSEAEKEIADYIKNLGNKPIYISHIAEATKIDIDTIIKVMKSIGIVLVK